MRSSDPSRKAPDFNPIPNRPIFVLVSDLLAECPKATMCATSSGVIPVPLSQTSIVSKSSRSTGKQQFELSKKSVLPKKKRDFFWMLKLYHLIRLPNPRKHLIDHQTITESIHFRVVFSVVEIEISYELAHCLLRSTSPDRWQQLATSLAPVWFNAFGGTSLRAAPCTHPVFAAKPLEI